MKSVVREFLSRVQQSNFYMLDSVTRMYQEALAQELSLEEHKVIFEKYNVIMREHIRSRELVASAFVHDRHKTTRFTHIDVLDSAAASYKTCLEINLFAELTGSTQRLYCQQLTFSGLK